VRRPICDVKASGQCDGASSDGAAAARFGYARGLTSLQRALGVALVVCVTAWPASANAAIDTLVRLEYQADEQGGCVGEDELRRMVTEQLGHDPFSPDAAQRVAVTIARTEVGFQGRIVWTEAGGRSVGERLLSSRSRDCRDIAANLAFAVALQLQLVERGASQDAGANAERPPPTADQIDRAPVIPERPPPAAESPRVPDQAPPARLALAVGAGPAVGLGMVPDATVFGRLFVVARWRRFSAELGADASLPVTLREPDGTGVVMNATGVSAAGCAHVSVMSACALSRVAWLRARGTGIAAPNTSWGRYNEIGARLAASREFGRFIASVHADGLVTLAQWNVVLNDAVVWSIPRVGAVVGLDVALRFF
jgi:hypothetical protein